jgi:hypothetical protein
MPVAKVGHYVHPFVLCNAQLFETLSNLFCGGSLDYRQTAVHLLLELLLAMRSLVEPVCVLSSNCCAPFHRILVEGKIVPKVDRGILQGMGGAAVGCRRMESLFGRRRNILEELSPGETSMQMMAVAENSALENST